MLKVFGSSIFPPGYVEAKVSLEQISRACIDKNTLLPINGNSSDKRDNMPKCASMHWYEGIHGDYSQSKDSRSSRFRCMARWPA